VRRIVTFPRGTCEGLLVLALERGADGFDAAAAAEIVTAEVAQRAGLWGVWVDGIEDWQAPGIDKLIDACGTTPILARRDVGSTAPWPAAEISWIVDASAPLRECKTEHALALRLGANPWQPMVSDLVVELDADQLPPSPFMFGMLADHARPLAAFCYIPREYPYRALLLNHLAACSTAWAVRWL
jgi:hypothetical protein